MEFRTIFLLPGEAMICGDFAANLVGGEGVAEGNAVNGLIDAVAAVRLAICFSIIVE